jgi:aminoglycoside phosphotransferase (APT) family kinase protein
MIGFPNFCNIETLRSYSAESAAMLDSLQRIVTAHAHECPQRNDIVHFDFHTNNILMEGDRITGVIDWEGSVSGDCAFDLATMLFYVWPFEELRDQLWRVLLDRAPRGAAAVYLAHMIVRQLDWSMRNHPSDEVTRYLRIGGDIIRAIRLP